jgi:hypothetical protein
MDATPLLDVPEFMSGGWPGRLSLPAMSGVLDFTREHPSKTMMPPITSTCKATTINTTFETFMGSFRYSCCDLPAMAQTVFCSIIAN